MDREKDRAFFEQYINKASINETDKYGSNADIKKRRKRTINLHGLTRHEAWDRVNMLLKGARSEGLQSIRIICGSGHHSDNLPVLAEHMISMLKRNARLYNTMHVDRNNNITLILGDE